MAFLDHQFGSVWLVPGAHRKRFDVQMAARRRYFYLSLA